MPYERSNGKQCVVFDCGNNQKNLHTWGQAICETHDQKHCDCPCLVPYKFYCLPKNEEKRRDWLKNINRKDFNPSSTSLVCSLHFQDGRPTKENPSPTLKMGYTCKSNTPARRPLIRRPLSEFNEKVKPVCLAESLEYEDSLERHETYTAEPLVYTSLDINTENNRNTESYYDNQCEAVCCNLFTDLCRNYKKPSMVDASTQTIDFVGLDHPYSYMKTSKSTGTQHTTAEFGIERITTDSEARFYTGLNITVLMSLISPIR